MNKRKEKDLVLPRYGSYIPQYWTAKQDIPIGAIVIQLYGR